MATELISIDELDGIVLKAMINLGYPEDEAHVIKDILMAAELRNNSQGISKLYDVSSPGSLKYNSEAGPLKVERESTLSAVVNGNQRAGMVALNKAVEMASVKAKQHGVGVVSTYNTSTSTGMLAYYAETLGKAGLIGIVLAQSPELVAPAGGKTAVFGTNPICIAVPTGDAAVGPLVVDLATASLTLFGVVTAKANGTPLPEGQALNAQGQPTVDPLEALQGALLPFGGYKGGALSLAVELLGGVLAGGTPPGGDKDPQSIARFEGAGGGGEGKGAPSKKLAKNWGNLVLAIDPNLLLDQSTFESRVRQTLHHVRQSGVAEGSKDTQVRLPGEHEKRIERDNLRRGSLSVSVALLSKIRELASPSSLGSTQDDGSGPKKAPSRLLSRL